MCHAICLPRLRSLDVIAGSERPPQHVGLEYRWEQRERQKFEIRLSERDDELPIGLATVKCTELEALKAKIGAQSSMNRWQEMQMQAVLHRAEHGPASTQPSGFAIDLEMVRARNLPFPGE